MYGEESSYRGDQGAPLHPPLDHGGSFRDRDWGEHGPGYGVGRQYDEYDVPRGQYGKFDSSSLDYNQSYPQSYPPQQPMIGQPGYQSLQSQQQHQTQYVQYQQAPVMYLVQPQQQQQQQQMFELQQQPVPTAAEETSGIELSALEELLQLTETVTNQPEQAQYQPQYQQPMAQPQQLYPTQQLHHQQQQQPSPQHQPQPQQQQKTAAQLLQEHEQQQRSMLAQMAAQMMDNDDF